MPELIREGDCVRIPDGRIARVREIFLTDRVRVRVRRTTGKTHQFLIFRKAELERVDCPGGWMSPEGYNRYLRATLAKTEERLKAGKR